MIADGSIVLRVISCDVPGGKVKCKCTNTATLGERKNCNLPGVNVDLPTLTEKDVDDIVSWGIPNDIDFIAASFVRKPSDIDNINKVVEGADIQIISKIENQEGLANFDEILKKTDAVMVARGGELGRKRDFLIIALTWRPTSRPQTLAWRSPPRRFFWPRSS